MQKGIHLIFGCSTKVYWIRQLHLINYSFLYTCLGVFSVTIPYIDLGMKHFNVDLFKVRICKTFPSRCQFYFPQYLFLSDLFAEHDWLAVSLCHLRVWPNYFAQIWNAKVECTILFYSWCLCFASFIQRLPKISSTFLFLRHTCLLVEMADWASLVIFGSNRAEAERVASLLLRPAELDRVLDPDELLFYGVDLYW